MSFDMDVCRMVRPRNSLLADDLRSHDSPAVHASGNMTSKLVVVVMDGMREFTTGPLQWALDNVVKPESSVILIGVMPWLNIPLFLKTCDDVWMANLNDILSFKDRREVTINVKYLKLRAIVKLCREYGVVPQKKVVMGYPPRQRAVEQITRLNPSWVVFDRHLRKDREFYAEKIPCKMVMLNDEGEADMIKSQPMIEYCADINISTSEVSPICRAPTPQLVVAEPLKKVLKEERAGGDNGQKWKRFLLIH